MACCATPSRVAIGPRAILQTRHRRRLCSASRTRHALVPTWLRSSSLWPIARVADLASQHQIQDRARERFGRRRMAESSRPSPRTGFPRCATARRPPRRARSGETDRTVLIALDHVSRVRSAREIACEGRGSQEIPLILAGPEARGHAVSATPLPIRCGGGSAMNRSVSGRPDDPASRRESARSNLRAWGGTVIRANARSSSPQLSRRDPLPRRACARRVASGPRSVAAPSRRTARSTLLGDPRLEKR